MKIWIDAQLSPALSPWLESTFGIEALAVRDLGLRDATDRQIFQAARALEDVVVFTKDSDFVALVNHQGPPPQILWLTCGNTSNLQLQDVLARTFSKARLLLESGEPLVEIQ